MQSIQDAERSERSYLSVSTRSHFDHQEGEISLAEGVAKTDYDFGAEWDDLEESDEIVVWVHGMDVGIEDAREEAERNQDSLRSTDSAVSLVMFNWDSHRPEGHDHLVMEVAARNGPKLAQWIEDFQRAHERPLCLIGHSLGSMVVFEALKHLDQSGRETSVSKVVTLGPGVEASVVQMEAPYGQGIESVAETYQTYYRTDDGILEWIEGATGWDGSLGRTGAADVSKTPENYEEIDVTEEVAGHFDYNNPENGLLTSIL